MKLLYSYLKNYRSLVFLALLLATINQVFSLMDPMILQRIIDQYATKSKELTQMQFIEGVAQFLCLAVGAAFISRLAKNFQDYYINTITQKLGAQIYADGLRHSLELPYSDFEDQRSGELLGKLQKVRSDVERVITAAINILFMTLVGVVVVTAYALTVNWLIIPLYFGAIPIIAFVSNKLSKKIKTIQKVIVGETTALAGATTESIRNIELVKSLGLAQQEIDRLNNTTQKILVLELKKVRYIRSLSFVQGTLVNFIRTSIQFVMMFLIFTQQITLGQYMTLFIFSFFIFGPLQELGSFISIYREAEVSLNNFDEILKKPKEVKAVNPTPLQSIDRLEFNGVTFKHQSASTNALEGTSFKVSKGETIAFVGPSGSGKTTLVKLLVGLYQPIAGKILYNGVEGTELDLDKLREKIGFVSQDAQLFSGTIRENLLFVNPKATDAECLEALNKAACQNLLSRADKGLDSLIGEGGVKVSGGEKQRLSIARALLRHPDLLICDEATSALDSLTEEEITSTIRDISKHKHLITILIAHRLSTIMHADRIYVFERGQMIESGKHLELLELKGLYYAMWRQQIGERDIMRSATKALSMN
ncbi:MAG: ABC transporter ATP-binding protein [Ignavibacteria bacterium]|nr:ABC transporter ATP-binding protein [Ignavibacteria bacterium]